jgi:hypothetical protein
MLRFFAPLALLALAACDSPRDACEREATKDLSIVRDLIADTEATIERGYAIQTQTRAVLYTDFCIGTGSDGGRFRFCNRIEPVETKEPVAVDLTAERRKLSSLKRKERELAREAEFALRRCALSYPQG